MSNGQVRNLSDLACEMKEFGRRTAQPTATGSFATQGSLVDFSNALVLLCEEVIALRRDIEEFKGQLSSTGPRKGSQPARANKPPSAKQETSQPARRPR